MNREISFLNEIVVWYDYEDIYFLYHTWFTGYNYDYFVHTCVIYFVANQRDYFKSFIRRESREGKTIIFKDVSLDSSICMQIIHTMYLYDSNYQALQSLRLWLLISGLENFF